MAIEYLACGNIMSDRIERQDGSFSEWNMGGPAFFTLSGIRLWTKACKLVCRFHHRMIENMVELIAEKNLTLVEKLEVVSRTTIREKLLTYLARQAEAAGARTFTIPMGRTALAEYLCTDRSAMTRELARMRDEGLIDYTKRTFTLRQ